MKETLTPSVLTKALRSVSKSKVIPEPEVLSLSVWLFKSPANPVNLSFKLLYLS